MELNLLEKKKQRLVFELPGADHTLCNALKQELWNDEEVTAATYAVKHPLKPTPRMVLETKQQEATAVLAAAIGRLKKEYKSVGTALAKV